MVFLIKDKETIQVLSGWLSNISAGWIVAMLIFPIFSDPNPILLLTVDTTSSIMALVLSIFFAKKVKSL